MNAKLFIWIFICCVVSIMAVAMLYSFSYNLRQAPGSFVRIYPPHVTDNEKARDIKYNSYYIAGVESDHIYLGNITAPLHMLKLNMTLDTVDQITISLANWDSYKFKSLKVTIDSTYFFMSDGTVPALFQGSNRDWQAERLIDDGVPFTQLTAMRPGSFASTVLQSGEQVLTRLLTNERKRVYNKDLLRKQKEGLFSTDGMLLYNKGLNRLIYLYYYRNQFIISDPNLNLIYEGRTIDTISVAKIEVDTIRSSGSVTMSAPPRYVNKHVSSYDHWLFIHSVSMANNEDQKQFEKSAVIDVYNILDGSYHFSFYLGDFMGTRLREFSVVDGIMIILYDHHITVRELHNRYFDEYK